MKFVFAQHFAEAIEQRPWLMRIVFLVEAGAMYLIWYLLRILGPERASRWGAGFLRTFGPRSPKKADLVHQQLKLVVPDASPAQARALARRSWENLGMVFGEYPNLARIAEGGSIELVDHVDLARYRAGGRSAIFFGAHYANWELLALTIARAGVPMVALYAPIQNPHLDRLMSRARIQLGCATHARGDSVRPLLKHLKQGGSIGTLIDLRMEDGTELPLFGHTTRLPTTAARLALRTGADLVPMHAERIGTARYRIHAGPALLPATDANSEDAISATTAKMIKVMEAWIREDPALWLLANRRWEKTVLDPTWAARRAAILGH